MQAPGRRGGGDWLFGARWYGCVSYWGGLNPLVLVLILFLVLRLFLRGFIVCSKTFVACLVFARIVGLAIRIVRALSVASMGVLPVARDGEGSLT